jgi:hypothetical protein
MDASERETTVWKSTHAHTMNSKSNVRLKVGLTLCDGAHTGHRYGRLSMIFFRNGTSANRAILRRRISGASALGFGSKWHVPWAPQHPFQALPDRLNYVGGRRQSASQRRGAPFLYLKEPLP